MSENHAQPRWGILYLTLPLAGGLFWFIQRAHVSGILGTILDIGALLVVFAFVEVWRWANTVALLHHPRRGDDHQPIYYAREVVAARPAGPDKTIQAVFVVDSRSSLFSASVTVQDSKESEDDVERYPRSATRS